MHHYTSVIALIIVNQYILKFEICMHIYISTTAPVAVCLIRCMLTVLISSMIFTGTCPIYIELGSSDNQALGKNYRPILTVNL